VSKPPRDASTKPVQRRLLIPLAVALLLLVGGFVTALLHMEHDALDQASGVVLANTLEKLEIGLESQARSLDALEEVFLRDANLSAALGALDRERLLAEYEHDYEHLREEHGITHFYFHGPDRVNLLRVHNPGKHGDLIDRFTAREAERTGKMAAGIELGPLGRHHRREGTLERDRQRHDRGVGPMARN